MDNIKLKKHTFAEFHQIIAGSIQTTHISATIAFVRRFPDRTQDFWGWQITKYLKIYLIDNWGPRVIKASVFQRKLIFEYIPFYRKHYHGNNRNISHELRKKSRNSTSEVAQWPRVHFVDHYGFKRYDWNWYNNFWIFKFYSVV